MIPKEQRCRSRDYAEAKPDEASLPYRPRMGTIKAASGYSGVSRSSMYDKAKERPDLFKKWGARTLVDFDVLDEILDALPQGLDIEAEELARGKADFIAARRRARKQQASA
jgi:hypothetical protein